MIGGIDLKGQQELQDYGRLKLERQREGICQLRSAKELDNEYATDITRFGKI
jgi:hypothetical protein